MYLEDNSKGQWPKSRLLICFFIISRTAVPFKVKKHVLICLLFDNNKLRYRWRGTIYKKYKLYILCNTKHRWIYHLQWPHSIDTFTTCSISDTMQLTAWLTSILTGDPSILRILQLYILHLSIDQSTCHTNFLLRSEMYAKI